VSETQLLDQILTRFQSLPPKEREAVARDAHAATADMVWVPNPGPQTEAYFCEADELFYGGQAGGGKSALAVGLAVTAHERSLILRRINKDAKKLAEAELLGNVLGGSREGWNGSDLIYRDGKRAIEFGGCELEADKQRYKGDPHDLIVFDEVTDFLESQYVFITIWNRTTTDGQRCRVVATGNPPTSASGLWVIKRWAPWLDPTHPKPAKPGELRWYLSLDDGKEIEVDGPGPHPIGDRMVRARSRTFIPARLSDNPDLARDGEYERVLDALPKELRDAYRDGKFSAALKDGEWQAIPTSWVKAAQSRWTENPPQGIPMCAIGVDVAQGGEDETVLAPRHDSWFAPLISVPGSKTPLASDVSGLIVKHRRGNAMVIVDLGGGYGGGVYEHLLNNTIPVKGHKGSQGSTARTKDRQLGFFNKRAEVWWKFREALDPDQEGGSHIALPDDPALVADLCAPTFSVTPQGIKIEPKDQLVKRLGRSPDKGDAVVMSWSAGAKMATDFQNWQGEMGGSSGSRPLQTTANMGHASARRRR
jgi:hypothetical protein